MKSLLSPVVTIMVALCTALCALARRVRSFSPDAMTVGVAHRLSRLSHQVLQAGTGPREDDQHHRPNGSGVERIQAILETDTMIPERPGAREPEALSGEIAFDHVALRL